MRPGQWLLSILFLVFAGVKVAEIGWQIEDWPLTNVPMFSTRFPPAMQPSQVHLLGTRGDAQIEIMPADLGLTRDEFNSRLMYVPNVSASCGQLGQLYNQGRTSAQRVSRLVARREFIARPGNVAAAPPVTVPCPLGATAG